MLKPPSAYTHLKHELEDLTFKYRNALYSDIKLSKLVTPDISDGTKVYRLIPDVDKFYSAIANRCGECLYFLENLAARRQ
jgi:hypothetical protein